jgi:predicted transcriptional regulator YdeE
MKTHRIKKLMLNGISTTTNNKNEFDENNAKIPKLWDDYVEQKVYNSTFNKSKEIYMYGVYSNYTSDLNGDYDVTIAVEVTKPKGAIIIEDQKFLVFKNKGELPQIVIDTWGEVWDYFGNENSEYKRTYNIDFEKYVSKDEIEIYISID